jgi:hypothetical protein
MKLNFRWQTAALISIFLCLALFNTSLAQQAANYDFNRNNRIDDNEFFIALDDWLAGSLDQNEFYLIIDLWTSAQLIGNNTPANVGTCPSLTNLGALKNGVPINVRNTVSAAALSTTPIDIAFQQNMNLPAGTAIQFQVSATTEGAEPRHTKFESPLPTVVFTNIGQNKQFGNTTLQTEASLPALYEWAQFTPYWSNASNSGSFLIEVEVQAPGCSQLKMRLTLNLNKSTSTTPGTSAGCPSPTRIMALRNGLHLGATSSGISAQDLTTPLDIAFENQVALPQGSNINLEISSDTIGLEPRNSMFLSTLSPGSFITLNPQLVRGNAVVVNELTLQPQFEWARFTPYWDGSVSSGRFTITATITAPNCGDVEVYRTYSMTRTSGGSTPPSNNANCPGPTSLVAVRNGLPVGGNSLEVISSALTTPMEIGFTQPTYLPPGANIILNITSDTSGLEPHNGEFLSTLSSGNFVNLGSLTLEGTTTSQNGINLQPQFGWAKFTPYWATHTTAGTFALRATINAPGCSQVIATRNYSMRKITSASIQASLEIQRTEFNTVLSSSSGMELQVEVFNLAGSSLYVSPKGPRVALSTSDFAQIPANGVLLYIVKFYDAQDQLQTSSLKKLVMLR